MYTRCPSCNATFRVTAAVLQMADGEVRCGACGGVFNALHTLLDDWTGADLLALDGSGLHDPATAPEARGSPGSDSDDAPDEPAEDNLEFNVPENEWQRFFISGPDESVPGRPEPGFGERFDAALDAPAESAAAGDAPDDNAQLPPRSVEEETADTDTWQAFLQESEAGDDAEDEADGAPLVVVSEEGWTDTVVMVRRSNDAAPDDEMPAAAEARPDTAPAAATDPREEPAPAGNDAEAMVPDDDAGRAAVPAPFDREPATGGMTAAIAAEAPPEPDTVLDWGPPPAFSRGSGAAPPRHTGRWLAASVLAALVLAGQAAAYFRDELAANPSWGAAVRAVAGRLGLTLYPAWPLDAYEVRGTKAIVEDTANGALDIVAEVAVTGRQPVGLPLVRVVLRDRWSNTVASGVFGANDYLAEQPPDAGLYAPGTLIPVQISLKDPGAKAQGFELDVCIADRHYGLRCKNVRDPFRR